MTIQPLGARVLLKPIERENVTAAGIVLPDTADYRDEIVTADVLSAGSDVRTIIEGDRVMAKRHLGDPVEIGGQKLLIVEEQDVIGLVRKEIA